MAAAVPVVAVVLAGAASYANSFDVPLQFDDVDVIVGAPDVHATELSFEALARAGHGFPLNRWLAHVSFAANHALHGLRAPGYHVVNLAFHLGASLLVLALAMRLLSALGFGDDMARRRAATLAAILFAVHPVHTQAVTYVVQRMTSMGAFFALASVLLWFAARGRMGGARVALGVGAAAAWYLALACKENYAVVPALVALLQVSLEPDLRAHVRAHWKSWAAAVVACAAAAGSLLVAYASVVEREQARFGIPVADRLLTQGRVLLRYLSLLVLPLPGRLHVDPAVTPSTGLLTPATTLPALLAVAGLVALAVWARRRAPLVTIAIGWFVVALAVEQTVLPVDLAFEHRLYFADVGFAVLAGATLVRFASVDRFGPWPAAAPLVLLLMAGTAIRNSQWHDPTTLYADALTGGSQARGLLNVAAGLVQQGRLDDAEAILRRAAALDPRDPSALVNLGSVALIRGDPIAAEGWFRRGLAVAPVADGWYDLGMALAQQRRDAEAMDAYRAALALAPEHADALVNLAVLQYRGGDRAGALASLDRAVRADAGSVSAWTNRAELLAAVGRHDEATADARRALALAPEDPVARALVARLGAQHREPMK